MPDNWQEWFGDIHHVLPTEWVGVIVTIAAVLCGGLIGIERERAEKPAGLRTLVLICLGSAIFTQASLLLSDQTSDRTRIAAQIVSGVGFLGAGAIIRERGLIIGVTTGAGIWATAAVGVVLGGGYVAAGIFFAILITMMLAGEPWIQRIAIGECSYASLSLTLAPDDDRTLVLIKLILDEHLRIPKMRIEEPSPDRRIVHVKYCTLHADHRKFLSDLMKLSGVKDVKLE